MFLCDIEGCSWRFKFPGCPIFRFFLNLRFIRHGKKKTSVDEGKGGEKIRN